MPINNNDSKSTNWVTKMTEFYNKKDEKKKREPYGGDPYGGE